MQDQDKPDAGLEPDIKPEAEVKISFERPQENTQQPNHPPRRLLEVLLDPRTLQGLMLVGGGLLVIGLVIWLWSVGVFANRLVVASCLGAASAALLGAGLAGFHYTRYKTASKGITLLGCLVMPLNLWFYDAQGLITLDQGGHLWIPALVCVAVYVLVARLLADPWFVHVIVGGVTMTGMLFLADRQVGRFWEIVPPSSFLVILGMLCIHLERAFAPGEGIFSRERFGREFFRAGHIVLSIGIAVLFTGHLCGRFYGPYLSGWGLLEVPAIASDAKLKIISLALVLGGAYSYIYSQLVVRPQGRYFGSAAFLLVWSSLLLFDILTIPLSIAALTLGMMIPLAFAGISIASKSETTQKACSHAAQLGTTILLVLGIVMTLGLMNVATVAHPNLWCAVLFAEGAVCFALASIRVSRTAPTVMATLSACAAIWQLLLFLDVTPYIFLSTLAILGVVCLAAGELAAKFRKEVSKVATISLWAGRLGISLGGAATILMALARLLTSETHWAVLSLLVIQVVAAVSATMLSRQPAWRRHFFILALGEILLSLLVLNSLSNLSFLQRGELLATLVGFLFISAGYLGWYREEETKQQLVSFNLAIGSLLTAVPLTLGLLAQRFGEVPANSGWVLLHEVGVLSIGMALLGAGILCRIRWSTLVGGGTIVVYLISLVGLIQLPDQLQTTAVTMMVGGGLFFGTAILLSLYRDRLLALPQRVQEGEGVFRVFKWR